MANQTKRFRRASKVGSVVGASVWLGIAFLTSACGAKFKTSPEAVEHDERGSGGEVAETAPSLGESGGLEDQVAIASPKVGRFPKSPLKDWVFPILDGGFGDMWCVCRPNSGTSPHIGVDLIDSAKLPNQISIAMSNGKVESVDYDPTCGWSVMFRGSGGALWRYLHLNKPGVTGGQEVVRGTTFGINRDYPKPGCGNGAHLHLERRSPGEFGSKEEFRSCQFGRASCYYNPVALIEKTTKLPNDSARFKLVNQTLADIQAEKNTSMALTTSSQEERSADTLVLGQADLEGVASQAACNTTHKASRMSDSKATVDAVRDSGLNVSDFSREAIENSSLTFAFRLAVRGNPENICPDGAAVLTSTGSCITSWKLILKAPNGTRYLAFEATATGNAPVEIKAETRVCVSLPEGLEADSLAPQLEATTAQGDELKATPAL